MQPLHLRGKKRHVGWVRVIRKEPKALKFFELKAEKKSTSLRRRGIPTTGKKLRRRHVVSQMGNYNLLHRTPKTHSGVIPEKAFTRKGRRTSCAIQIALRSIIYKSLLLLSEYKIQEKERSTPDSRSLIKRRGRPYQRENHHHL